MFPGRHDQQSALRVIQDKPRRLKSPSSCSYFSDWRFSHNTSSLVVSTILKSWIKCHYSGPRCEDGNKLRDMTKGYQAVLFTRLNGDAGLLLVVPVLRDAHLYREAATVHFTRGEEKENRVSPHPLWHWPLMSPQQTGLVH
ncbi:hypothetical protein GN956_G2889 [Arapaima gigas]